MRLQGLSENALGIGLLRMFGYAGFLGIILFFCVGHSEGAIKKQARWIGPGFMGVAEPVSDTKFSFVPKVGSESNKVCFFTNFIDGAAFVTNRGDILYREGRIYSLTENSLSDFLEGWTAKEVFIGGNVSSIYGRGRYRREPGRFSPDAYSAFASNPGYSVLDLGEVYSGIEVKLVCFSEQIGKLICVNPGSDLSRYCVRFLGGVKLEVDDSGDLLVELKNVEMKFRCPVAFQIINGRFKPVKVAFRLDQNCYGFDVGPYDLEEVLILDPMINMTYQNYYDAFSEVIR